MHITPCSNTVTLEEGWVGSSRKYIPDDHPPQTLSCSLLWAGAHRISQADPATMNLFLSLEKNYSPSPTIMSSVTTSTKRSKPVSTMKSKRVRTGCLTCRERHLKCDEEKPTCKNCTRSRRECKWGVRLSYLPAKLFAPKRIPRVKRWQDFCDESRLIASDYPHGLRDYEQELRRATTPVQKFKRSVEEQQTWQHTLDSCQQSQQPRSYRPVAGRLPSTYPKGVTLPPSPPQSARHLALSDQIPPGMDYPPMFDDCYHPVKLAQSPPAPEQRIPPAPRFPTQSPLVKQEAASDGNGSSTFSNVPQYTQAPRVTGRGFGDGAFYHEPSTPPPDESPSDGEREYLGSPEEIHYMQVFTEEVGVWMDSFDREKHFSQLIPYEALKSPMLLNAFLACGVMPLSVASPELDDKALCYYNTATTHLLRNLQNPDRDTEECAAAAVILNVYEIMSDSPSDRMKHAAGARALIKDCGWNGKTPGIGSACFWLNIEMEVLDCLAMKWRTAWNPDYWGVDMSFEGAPGEISSSGDEELWVQRMIYIVAKIANFRATSSEGAKNCVCENWKLGASRHVSWMELKELCLKWNSACPRTMHPVGYLPASQATSKSLFPNIWLTRRAAILGRLFYHTALCVLGQTNPLEPTDLCEEMRNFSLHHAHQLCGIVAHTKDRGISSVAIRCLAATGSALSSYAEQQEVLGILSDLGSRSGWRVNRLKEELKSTWGWSGKGRSSSNSNTNAPPPASVVTRMIGGNPLSSADFNLPNHPYQNWYQPPNRSPGFAPSFL